MNASIQDALKEAFALAPSQVVVYDTLEILQTGIQDAIYLVRSRALLTAKDENGISRTFEPTGFQFSLPPSTEEGFQSLNVSIDNVGRRINEFVNTAKANRVPIQVIYRPYVSDNLEAPAMNPPLVLYLKDIKINAMQVVGRATFMDVVNKGFPADLYLRSRFPSLG